MKNRYKLIRKGFYYTHNGQYIKVTDQDIDNIFKTYIEKIREGLCMGGVKNSLSESAVSPLSTMDFKVVEIDRVKDALWIKVEFLHLNRENVSQKILNQRNVFDITLFPGCVFQKNEDYTLRIEESTGSVDIYNAETIYEVGFVEEFKGRKRFYSNFWETPVYDKWDGITYPTSEHFYVAMKCTTADEVSKRKSIAIIDTPGNVKSFGRKLSPVYGWNDRKVHEMRRIVYQKFFQNEELKDKLLASGRDYIQEGNTWNDTFWGVNLKTGEGQNYLGRILMEVRAILENPDNFEKEILEIDRPYTMVDQSGSQNHMTNNTLF